MLYQHPIWQNGRHAVEYLNHPTVGVWKHRSYEELKVNPFRIKDVFTNYCTLDDCLLETKIAVAGMAPLWGDFRC